MRAIKLTLFWGCRDFCMCLSMWESQDCSPCGGWSPRCCPLADPAVPGCWVALLDVTLADGECRAVLDMTLEAGCWGCRGKLGVLRELGSLLGEFIALSVLELDDSCKQNQGSTMQTLKRKIRNFNSIITVLNPQKHWTNSSSRVIVLGSLYPPVEPQQPNSQTITFVYCCDSGYTV